MRVDGIADCVVVALDPFVPSRFDQISVVVVGVAHLEPHRPRHARESLHAPNELVLEKERATFDAALEHLFHLGDVPLGVVDELETVPIGILDELERGPPREDGVAQEERGVSIAILDAALREEIEAPVPVANELGVIAFLRDELLARRREALARAVSAHDGPGAA